MAPIESVSPPFVATDIQYSTATPLSSSIEVLIGNFYLHKVYTTYITTDWSGLVTVSDEWKSAGGRYRRLEGETS